MEIELTPEAATGASQRGNEDRFVPFETYIPTQPPVQWEEQML